MKGKKILSLALILILGFSVIACTPEDNGNTGTSDNNGVENGGTTDNDAGEETPPADAETVVVWNQIFEEWNQEFFTQKAEEYNQLGRGYVVEQEFIAGDAWEERMTSSQAAGTAPDTYILAYGNITGSAMDGLLLPLEDYFTTEQLDDINDNVREMVSYEGTVYAYPQLVEPSTVLFYRTDLFEAAGIEEVPTTWDELIEAAKLLTTDDMFGLSVPDFPSMGWSTWGMQYATSGHLAITDNWDAPAIDQGYIDLANFYATLYEEGVVPAQALTGYTDMRDFGEESVAMAFNGSWGVAQILNEFPELADKFDVAVPPTQDGNQDKILSTNGGWSYVIDAMSDIPEGAADYISWLLAEDVETSADFFELAQYSKAAPRESVAEYIAEIAGDSPWAETINYISARAIPEPNYPWDISATVALMIENTALGVMTAEDAAAQATQTIQDIIDNENLAGTNPRQ